MEKKLYELKIDEEFRGALPPLKDVEYSILEEKIKSNGCEMPLITWNGTLIDGHNRYKICHENGIPFEYKEMEFDCREAVRIWIIENQIGRRNLTPFQSCEIVYPLKEALAKEAKKIQGTRTDLVIGKKADKSEVDKKDDRNNDEKIDGDYKTGNRIGNESSNESGGWTDKGINKENSDENRAEARDENGDKNNFLLISTKSKGGSDTSKNDTRKRLAKMANVGSFTFHHAEKLIREADDEMKERLRSGAISINEAYNRLVGKGKWQNDNNVVQTAETDEADQDGLNDHTDRDSKETCEVSKDGLNENEYMNHAESDLFSAADPYSADGQVHADLSKAPDRHTDFVNIEKSPLAQC